ncbi:MAG: 16S rRNA methyltransferase [Epsilonproteobacteria bacterium]|nr:16S rRNA methyltransferase [Campylobacterota bacterium]
MLTIVIAESELETIPRSIWNHPVVTTYAKQHNKKPGMLLLDSNFHHNAMKTLNDWKRRGRPDIIHIVLLNLLESIVNKKNDLKIIIHTRNNEAIYIHPQTRLMRNYTRFVGLMEQLFEKKNIQADDKTLFEIKENKYLEKIIDEEEKDFVLVFSVNGKKVKPCDYFNHLKKKSHKNILCVIGGFPHGDFHNDISKKSDDIISIFDEELMAWSVLNEILVNYENTLL